MKASEIIKADAVKNKVDPDKALRAISDLIKRKSAILMQENNSVLLVQKSNDTSAQLHLFTLDSPVVLAKSILKFVKRSKELGIKTWYGKADNEKIIELMRRIGLNIQKSDLPQYNWKAQI
jgi:hypothetical protein